MHGSIFNPVNACESFQSPAQDDDETGDMKTCLVDRQQIVVAHGLALAIGDPCERAPYRATLPLPSLRALVPHDTVARRGSSSPTYRVRANHIWNQKLVANPEKNSP
jgi:hypothetical protein